MNKCGFVTPLRLPPGFRFHPTDEELVVQYLKRKVFNCPLPASIIPELGVCKTDPWDLPGNKEQERYFFSSKEAKYPNGNRSNRATYSGYWKATGIDKHVVSSRNNHPVGMKKTLVFYKGKPPHGSRTDWIMHEYRLTVISPPPPPPPQTTTTTTTTTGTHPQGSDGCTGNWVLCRIFLKKRFSRNSEDYCSARRNGEVGSSVFYDFMTPETASPASSASSGITEVDDADERSCSSSGCSTVSFSLKS